jgi:hypothetical protein
MKLPLLLITVLVPAALFAQTTRRTNEDPDGREVFYVLKSNKTIKEGPYSQYTHYRNRLTREGFYKNNLKDSLLTYYSFAPQNKLSSSGNYKADRRVGIWSFYSYKGDLNLQYDYTEKKAVFIKVNSRDSSAKFNVVKGADTIRHCWKGRQCFLKVMNGWQANLCWPEVSIGC